MKSRKTLSVLRYVAIVGNMIFVVWVLHNGMNEGFKGTPVEVLSYISLVVLLLLNVFLIGRRQSRT
jgi:hypothetical protein